MKKNRSRILFLLIVTVTLFTLISTKDKIINSLFTKPIERPFSQITAESIKQIDIVNDKKTISLYKKNNQWYLKENQIEFLADQDKTNKIIIDFTQITEEELVSDNKKRFTDFGIEKNRIIIKTINKNYSIYIGQLSGANKTYIKIDDQNAVFSVSGFGDVFSSSTNDYRDLSVNFLKDEKLITELTINNIVIKKNKNRWLVNNQEVKPDQISFYLNDLKTLKATDLLIQKPILYNNPELTITLRSDQEEKTAKFYPIDSKQEDYYLVTSNSKFIFQISATSISTLKKEEKDFLKEVN